jgi:sec-independent protein translocase protein TatB
LFDVGWQELLIIGLVAIIVIGPKELPRVLRTVTLGIRKVRGMARDFQDGLEELAREADLQDLRKEIEEGVGDDLQKEIEGVGEDLQKDIESIGDPARDIEESVREIGGALDEQAKPKTSSAAAEEPAPPSVEHGADDKKTGGAA